MQPDSNAPTVGGALNIESSAFQDNSLIPQIYTCDGEEIPPPLTVTTVPEGTDNLVLIVEDPDAPSGTFIHWIVWNIGPNASVLTDDQKHVPTGAIEGTNSAGTVGYVAPCPPSGSHRYIFRLYAIDQPLGLSSSATVEDLYQALEQVTVLSRARITGTYER